MATRVTEIKASIYEVNKRVLVVAESFTNHDTTKLDATKSGIRRKRHTITYHQWRYSFKKRKKYQVNRITVTNTVKIPMETAPHLIGKHPQHERSLTNSVEQTQMQQQHGALTGGDHGSSSSSFYSSSGFLLEAFFEDFFSDFFSDGGLEPAGASSAGASSPPSRSLSYSLY
jgi:hypothetical protein